MSELSRQVLLEKLKTCVINEETISHSGLKLKWKCDLDQIPDYREMFAYELKLHKDPVVAGIQTGGAKIAMKSKANGIMAIYPTNPYDYQVQIIAQHPIQYFSTVLVDDVVTTGNSLAEAKFILEAHGIRVSNMAVVLDRRKEFPKEANFHLQIKSLFHTTPEGEIVLSEER